MGVQIAETAKNSRYVQESVAGVAYGLGWLLALNNPRGAVRCLTRKNSQETPMPMIDVYVPADLFPVGSDRRLAEELTSALLRAEGVTTPAAVHLANTAAYIHRLDPKAVHTAGADSARTVRVQVITPPGALNRDGQKSLVAEATQIIAKIAGDPTQGARTWVLLTEAAEGGWGIAGTAFGREEFAALAARKSTTT
jgi:phenylpyruvate tautomerase PptA (4-oxalocrotonate tautomerase family)